MKTVFDVINNSKDGSAVMIQRHYSYLSGPTASRAKNEDDVFARNYSEIEPSVLFLCDKVGIELGWRHGKMIAETGLSGINIIASHQGRGPDSGLRISEGYHEITGKWLPVSCHRAVDYPIYNYDPALKAIMEDKDPMVARWLNGLRPNLIKSDTPESFHGRVTGFIETFLKRKESGIQLITTHFELCVLAHSIYVEKKNLGDVSEKYVPQKGRGILLVRDSYFFDGDEDVRIEAFNYDSDLNIIVSS